MKSLLVIVLFLLSIVAVVAMVASRNDRVAVVPVRIHSPRSRAARSARALERTVPGVTRVDLTELGRELRFRQAFPRD